MIVRYHDTEFDSLHTKMAKWPANTIKESLANSIRSYGTAVTIGVFIGSAVSSGVIAGLMGLAALRSTHLRKALEDALGTARALADRALVRSAGPLDDDAEIKKEMNARIERLERAVEKLQSETSRISNSNRVSTDD